MGRRSQRSRVSQQAKERVKHSVKASDSSDENANRPVDISAAGDKTEAAKRKKGKSLKSETENSLEGEGADAIAAGYASTEVEQNPQTCCSNCKTIFEVSPELLSSSDTRVRCGECLSIFDALTNLRQLSEEGNGALDSELDSELGSEPGDEQARHSSGQAHEDQHTAASRLPDAGAAALAGLANNDSTLDVTYADFGLFSADAALQNVEYLDETVEVQSFDFDDPGSDEELDDTFSETLFAHGPEVDARSILNETDARSDNDDTLLVSALQGATGLAKERPEARLQDSTRSGHDSSLAATLAGDGMDQLLDSLERPQLESPAVEVASRSWKVKGALSLLVILLAIALYGYRERQSLQNSRWLRPVVESFCSVIDCTLAEPVDLDSLQVLKRSVFSHPSIEDALLINIGFINKASFAQRYPVLEIRLTDRNGRLVVKNSFEPADYLDNWAQGDMLAAGQQLDVTLDLDDPGNDAMSFELDFR